jgi:hypothetical protein
VKSRIVLTPQHTKIIKGNRREIFIVLNKLMAKLRPTSNTSKFGPAGQALSRKKAPEMEPFLCNTFIAFKLKSDGDDEP